MKSALVFAISFLFSNHVFALSCHGTEPFWRAEISDHYVSFAYPEHETTVYPVTYVEAPMGMEKDYISIYFDSRGPLAIVKKAECNNGMSDGVYPNEVILFTGTTVFSGCCGQPVHVPEPESAKF